jgi:hypothetical protein
MRNDRVGTVINDTVDNCEYSSDFKNALKQYVINKFDTNVSDNDLKNVLYLLDVEEED